MDNLPKGTGFTNSQKSIFEMKTNHILAIGIDDYIHQPKLNNPVDDCKKLIELLCTKYDFSKNNVTEMYNHETTRGNILKQLKKYRNLTALDNLVIVFSGHGYYDKKGKVGYWIPIGAEDSSDYISTHDIKTELRAYEIHHVVIIADSCFSGALNRDTLPKDHLNFNHPAAIKLYKKKSRWSLTSGRIELVYDGTEGENSPFVKSILSELRHNENKRLLLSELAVKVTSITNRNANQTPSFGYLREVNDEDGQFSFILKDEFVSEKMESHQNDNVELYQSSNISKGFNTDIEKLNQLLEEDKLEEVIQELATKLDQLNQPDLAIQVRLFSSRLDGLACQSSEEQEKGKRRIKKSLALIIKKNI